MPSKLSRQASRDQIIVINVSGRGDKDCVEVSRLRGMPLS